MCPLRRSPPPPPPAPSLRAHAHRRSTPTTQRGGLGDMPPRRTSRLEAIFQNSSCHLSPDSPPEQVHKRVRRGTQFHHKRDFFFRFVMMPLSRFKLFCARARARVPGTGTGCAVHGIPGHPVLPLPPTGLLDPLPRRALRPLASRLPPAALAGVGEKLFDEKTNTRKCN